MAGACPWTGACRAEIVELDTTIRRDGSPGREYPRSLYPGGRCDHVCDPYRDDACGECARCVHGSLLGESEAEAQCLLHCTQDLDGVGGCPSGYACNRGELACVPSCVVSSLGVDTCQFTFEDRDADPSTPDVIVDEGERHPSLCNTLTGLCETTGRADATAGDDCETDLDCEDDGECIRSGASDPPGTLSDGYCVRRGCNFGDLACREGDVCARSVLDLPGGACLDGCVVGAETDDAERVGPGGGNPGCAPGEACWWDGVHRVVDPFDGACFAGNYNTVPSYNVGAACSSDIECWSPFGRGRCLFLDGRFMPAEAVGVCAVAGCAEGADGLPGLLTGSGAVAVPRPEGLCRTRAVGGYDVCVAFTPRDTFCLGSCITAADCPTGYACASVGDSQTCWPRCWQHFQCAADTLCLTDFGSPCDPRGEGCRCRAPSADSGPLPADASEPDDAGTSAMDAPTEETDAFSSADLDAPP